MVQPMASFVDPVFQARLSALLYAVRNLRLNEAARAVEKEKVVDGKTGEPVAWIPAPMVIPWGSITMQSSGHLSFCCEKTVM